jgi:hypothetical protein
LFASPSAVFLSAKVPITNHPRHASLHEAGIRSCIPPNPIARPKSAGTGACIASATRIERMIGHLSADYAATVHTAGQVAHVLYPVTKEHGPVANSWWST